MTDGDLAGHGADLILSLPEDVLALISAHLRPRDLLALSAASRRLRDALSAGDADKAWLAQCRRLLPSPAQLLAWRTATGGSSLAVCRFLHSAAPLLGLWAHQNPELGNLVVALPGFLSLVAVRCIPQELSDRLRWAPVFELLADAHGRPAILFLHGHHPTALFPGVLSSLHPHANVLFLEGHTGQPPLASSQFARLAFGDRRRLLKSLVAACRVTLPPDLAAGPLFTRTDEDLPLLALRRKAMLRLHEEATGGMVPKPVVEGILLEEAKKKTVLSPAGNGGDRTRLRRSFSAIAGYVRNGLRQMVTRSASANSRVEYTDTKHLALDEFLCSGDNISISLRGARMRLSTYRAWPSMHDNRFALYKLTVQPTMPGREYSGLWGGTFGWPPGRPQEEDCKPGKPLFFLLLSYEEDSEGKLLLIATKVLEGTYYVVHPNGSSMFIARMGEPSTESFPWQTDGESCNVDVEKSFAGDGIASGYGFRYPGSKPGSLFVLQNGQLAFVWKDNRSVLALQRLDLEELLKKGERVPALPPISNFSYLTKSYSNVFAGFPGSSDCQSSPRNCSMARPFELNWIYHMTQFKFFLYPLTNHSL